MKKFKEFRPTSLAIDNKTSVFFLVIILGIFGFISYQDIPKEQFPDIVIPTILVNTVYPGTSPGDMENLVTRPLEKNLKSISGVKKITSSSVQDFSAIAVEFNTDVDVADAKRKVKDAVDKTKNDLPNNLLQDPQVMEIDISEIPIMQINLSGDIDMVKLKKYADLVQDRIESFKEITRVDIIGALDREIQINVDMYKMQAAAVSFTDIENAVSRENVTISGGTIDTKGMKRSIRVDGEFKNMETIRNIQFKSGSGAIVRLTDIAEVLDTNKDRESYARLDGKNVVTLNVIKKSGENLLNASDQIKTALDEFKKDKFPSNLNITITADQSKFTRSTLEELNNTIIIGFILVTIVLMFFMGLTNALFVGLSVPLSMALAYIVMPELGYTMNMLVMFSFIFALGIVVDDAIVVVENTHRIYHQNHGTMDIVQAAKYAAGEVFAPILSGTLTTLAPFFPLVFWPGIIGKFMHYIPVVLIITLFASLIVAYIFNPVFAVTFMTHSEEGVKVNKKKIFIISAAVALFSGIFYASESYGIANFLMFLAISILLHNLFGEKVLLRFQKRFIPAIMNIYERLLRRSLRGRTPYFLFGGMFAFLIFGIIITRASGLKVVSFPVSDPQYIYTYITLPVGSQVEVSDSIASLVEKRVRNVVGDHNPDVESVIANVALGASENKFDRSVTAHKAKVTLSFVQYSLRTGPPTVVYLDKIRDAVKDIRGAQITVDQNQMGPPAGGKAVNIEISGDNLDELIAVTAKFKTYVEALNIKGIEQLKSDFDETKPELVIKIDRERANREGISTGQVGMEIRTAVLGKEISKYRDGEDQYSIQLRFSKDVRENINKVLNSKITYRDMNTGLLRQIPISAVAHEEYVNTYGAITRKNVKRVITLASNVLSGYNANEINKKISDAMPGFKKSDTIDIRQTGEQEDQKEVASFLGKAMLLSLFLILFILISQFNSTSKPTIILAEVLFSIIGVLMGYVIFGMTVSVVMTGLGIVALAGIVVRNGILLVEFTDVLKSRGYKTREAIIQAGKTRITPVLLTATATILGLLPLAIGLKINFTTLFTELNPHIGLGSDITSFFSPLAWAIIFGLSFATFLTLVMIPVMYYIAFAGKIKTIRTKNALSAKAESLGMGK
jgi:multidrug efflux pump subunit AcrB